MQKVKLYQYNNIQDDLLFWIKQFLAPKVYSSKEKKLITKEDRDKICENLLESNHIDMLRGHIRVARSKGLYNLPDYLNPLYKLYMYIVDDMKIDDIQKLDTTFINIYVEIGLAKNTSKTQQLHYDQIRSLFKFIENNNSDEYKFNIGFLRSGEKTKSPVNKTKKTKQTFLEPSDLAKFIGKLKDLKTNHPNNFHTRVMIKFLCCGGLRKEELVRLQLSSYAIEDVNGEKHIKILIDGKGDKQRIVYILYSLMGKEFEEFISLRISMQKDSNALFITRDSTEYSSRSVEDMVFRAYKNTGYGSKGLSIHSLRRSFIVYLHSSNVTLENIGSLLGYSPIEMGEIYVYLSEQRKYKVVDLSQCL